MTEKKPRKRYNKGSWMVERERGHLDPWQRPAPALRDKPIDDIVPKIMKEFGVESHFWETALIDEWVELVGSHLSRHTRPGRYERKILTVFVNNSVYLSELSMFGKAEILQKLQQRFGRDKIRDIHLQIDPDRGGGG